MAIAMGNMIIEGIGYSAGQVVISEEGPIAGSFAVSDGMGYLPAESIVCITDQPAYYVVKNQPVEDTSREWLLYGNCGLLPKKTIYMSSGVDSEALMAMGVSLLQSSIIETTTSDANGSFNFSTPISSGVTIWAQAPLNLSTAQQFVITTRLEPISQTGTYLRAAGFTTANSGPCQPCLATGVIQYSEEFPMASYNGIEGPVLPPEASLYDNYYLIDKDTLILTDEKMYWSDEQNAYGFAIAQPIYAKSTDDNDIPTWKTNGSTVQGCGSIVWSNVDILNKDTGSTKRSSNGNPTLAAICQHCKGNGYIEAVTTNTFPCPSCDGDGAIKVGTCPVCNGTKINTSLYKYPRCKIRGTWPYGYGTDTLYVSYVDDNFDINNIEDTQVNIDYLRQMSTYSEDFYATDFYITINQTDAASILNASQKWVVWAEVTDNEAPDIIIDTAEMVEGGALPTSDPCLAGHTLIATPEGQKRLDSIKQGDIVLSSEGPTVVIKIAGPQPTDYNILYTFENNIEIYETAPHRFFNVEQGIYQYLPQWNIGEHAVDINGNHVALLSKQQLEEPSYRFSLITAAGDYYANNLLNGDITCNKKLIAEATPEHLLNIVMSMKDTTLKHYLHLEGASFLP